MYTFSLSLSLPNAVQPLSLSQPTKKNKKALLTHYNLSLSLSNYKKGNTMLTFHT